MVEKERERKGELRAIDEFNKEGDGRLNLYPFAPHSIGLTYAFSIHR